MRLPRWFVGVFLAALIVVVIPMLAVWPLYTLGEPEAPRPIIRVADTPDEAACRSYLIDLLDQLEDYTSSALRTARNLGGEQWFITMRSWRSDLELVSTRCSLETTTNAALKKTYQALDSLSSAYLEALNPLPEKRKSLLGNAKSGLGQANSSN